MKAIDSRIRRLHGRLCPDHVQSQRLWVLVRPSYGLALDLDRCVDILSECGFLPTSRFGCLNFCGIPDGLNAKQLEKYLRTNGTRSLDFDGDQKRVGHVGARKPSDNSRSKHAQMSGNVLR